MTNDKYERMELATVARIQREVFREFLAVHGHDSATAALAKVLSVRALQENRFRLRPAWTVVYHELMERSIFTEIDKIAFDMFCTFVVRLATYLEERHYCN